MHYMSTLFMGVRDGLPFFYEVEAYLPLVKAKGQNACVFNYLLAITAPYTRLACQLQLTQGVLVLLSKCGTLSQSTSENIWSFESNHQKLISSNCMIFFFSIMIYIPVL